MILLDTHIWVWWVSDISKLGTEILELISNNEETGISISIISIWEVTKLIEKNKIKIKIPLEEWMDEAIKYPGMNVLNLSKEIILNTTALKNFHKDPADQLIVSTSIINNIPLLTMDRKILDYPYVETIKI
ncbi:MAG: type II toxin-antitoxin system VapC family toxin [Ignavibacteria bacterium]